MRVGGTNTCFVQPSIILAFGNGEPFSETRYHFDRLRHRAASRTDAPADQRASCVTWRYPGNER